LLRQHAAATGQHAPEKACHIEGNDESSIDNGWQVSQSGHAASPKDSHYGQHAVARQHRQNPGLDRGFVCSYGVSHAKAPGQGPGLRKTG